MVIAERAKQEQAVELGTATVQHHRRGNWTNAAVVSRTPGFSQQNVRNVRSKEYAVFICIVDSGNITSDNCIALEELGNIVSGITICGTSS